LSASALGRLALHGDAVARCTHGARLGRHAVAQVAIADWHVLWELGEATLATQAQRLATTAFSSELEFDYGMCLLDEARDGHLKLLKIHGSYMEDDMVVDQNHGRADPRDGLEYFPRWLHGAGPCCTFHS
jgi:hypothetical protein